MRLKSFLTENLSSEKEIKDFLLYRLHIEDESLFIIHDDLSVTLDEDLDINGNYGTAREVEKFPIVFREIKGDISIANCALKTLEGLPKEINGSVHILNTKISDLKFCPTLLGKNCDLVLLKNTNLTSLEGCPSNIPGSFSISYCHALASLEFGPTTVERTYKVDTNQSLVSIKGLPANVGKDVSIVNNRVLKSLSGISKMLKSCNGTLDVSGNQFNESVIGVLLVKGVKEIRYAFGGAEAEKAFNIIIDCFTNGENALICQNKMIKAGLKDFAKV